MFFPRSCSRSRILLAIMGSIGDSAIQTSCWGILGRLVRKSGWEEVLRQILSHLEGHPCFTSQIDTWGVCCCFQQVQSSGLHWRRAWINICRMKCRAKLEVNNLLLLGSYSSITNVHSHICKIAPWTELSSLCQYPGEIGRFVLRTWRNQLLTLVAVSHKRFKKSTSIC